MTEFCRGRLGARWTHGSEPLAPRRLVEVGRVRHAVEQLAEELVQRRDAGEDALQDSRHSQGPPLSPPGRAARLVGLAFVICHPSCHMNAPARGDECSRPPQGQESVRSAQTAKRGLILGKKKLTLPPSWRKQRLQLCIYAA